MRLFVNTGDSGLKRQLQEAKSHNRVLKNKAIALETAVAQLRKQVDDKIELQKQIAQYGEENKQLAGIINRQEEVFKELMKEAV